MGAFLSAGMASRDSPLVAQLAQLEEHRPRIGLLGQIGKGLAQRAITVGLVRRKKVLILLSSSSVVTTRLSGSCPASRRACRAAVRLSGSRVEREAQVVLDVVVARVDARVVGQPRELLDEGLVQLRRVAAVVAVAGAGVEQRVAARTAPAGRCASAGRCGTSCGRACPCTSSSTVLPTLITSPALTPRSMPAMRVPRVVCAITLAPVAATTAALPPVWSWCSCVLRICVIVPALVLRGVAGTSRDPADRSPAPRRSRGRRSGS